MQQRKEKAEKLFCAANSAAALLLGACVYACFNQDSYFGEWMCMLFPGLRRIGLREGWMFLRNWGGDFLWAYALFFAMYLAARGYFRPMLRAMGLAAALSAVVETAQLIRIDFLRSGTFDILDILVEWAAIGLGAALLIGFRQMLRERRDGCEQQHKQ